ncbi:MAG TPA: hypothetical protein VFD70_24910 [Anaerolineae bacterium]|nr:hypothetical protein [Anaerolineae bacterium]
MQESLYRNNETSNPSQERPVPSQAQGVSVSHWFEMSEDEYIRFRFAKTQVSFERERAAKQNELGMLGPRAHAKWLALVLRLKAVERALEEIEQHGLTPERVNKYRLEYRDRIKDAIRHGEPVPPAIIAQRVEFQRAFDGRARYEKGRHTSFANNSIAVDLRLWESRGVKIKLQNGDAMRAEVAEEIARGLEEIEAAVGCSLCGLLKATNITIAHTQGKHPFMRGDAGGLYSSTDRTVTIGTHTRTGRLIRSLAHELLGHWLDYEAGATMQAETRVKKGKHYLSISALSEYSVAHGQRSEDRDVCEDGYVIAFAASRMRDRMLAEKIARQKDQDMGLAPDDREIYRFVLGRGDYYYRPREIWARLCEMWAARHFAQSAIAFETFEWYTQRAAYWSATDFEILEPLVANALHWRLTRLGSEGGSAKGEPDSICQSTS